MMKVWNLICWVHSRVTADNAANTARFIVLPCGKGDIFRNTAVFVRGNADKSLAPLGRKEAAATKLGIYSTYSPRSSIHFLARCSMFCKSLKKNQKFVRPTRSPRQLWLPRRTKNGERSIFFQSREQVVARRSQIRRIGWMIKTL